MKYFKKPKSGTSPTTPPDGYTNSAPTTVPGGNLAKSQAFLKDNATGTMKPAGQTGGLVSKRREMAREKQMRVANEQERLKRIRGGF